MNNCVIEWAPFRLRADRSEADLIAASDEFQNAFLKSQPGFIRRETLRTGQGQYADLVHWRSREDADAVMQKAMNSPICHAFFSVMDMESQDPAEGVKHFASIRVYG